MQAMSNMSTRIVFKTIEQEIYYSTKKKILLFWHLFSGKSVLNTPGIIAPSVYGACE